MAGGSRIDNIKSRTFRDIPWQNRNGFHTFACTDKIVRDCYLNPRTLDPLSALQPEPEATCWMMKKLKTEMDIL